MDKVLLEVEELKTMIINSDEYREYEKSRRLLDDNNEIKSIISKIKKKQKEIINKEHKGIDKEEDEFEVKNLFKKLDGYDEYTNYIASAKKLNMIITEIQKKFEEYFNEFII